MTIFVLEICTESFLSSSGFEFRKETFGCLVDYLERRNVSDESFDVAESFDISNANCSEILSQKYESFYGDLKARLHCFYLVYDATSVDCEEVEKPLCTGSDFIDKDNRTNASCYNKNSGSMTSAEKSTSYKQLKQNCAALSECFKCVNTTLASTDYELIRFHATAVNVTVIEFQVWKYFSISPRVKVLVNDGLMLELNAMETCKNRKKCKRNVKLCQ